MSRQRITYAILYEPFFIPGGIGQVDKTMPPERKTVPNLAMYLLDSGQVLLEWGPNRDKPFRCVVGAATVKMVILAPDEQPKLKTPEDKQDSKPAPGPAPTPVVAAPVSSPSKPKPQVKITPSGPKVVGEPEAPKSEAEKAGQHFKPKAAGV